MIKTPLISVVMATYNGEQFIDEAIQSVLDQSFQNFEFIIVNDGSTDRTAEIIASFKDKRIIYLKKSNNSGIADSLNIGISKARGRYIARMDDDDLCLANRFEEQIKVLEKHSNIVLCGSSVLIKNASEIKVNPEFHDDIKIELMFKNAITHPSVMMRKDALLKCLYQSDKVPSEDYDLWSRLIWYGEFYNIPDPLLIYRYHEQSETSMRRREQLAQNVSIVERLYGKIGFSDLISNEYLRIFIGFDYSISVHDLIGLISWFEQLKSFNAMEKKFATSKFNRVADANLERYLISFFTNKRVVNKLIPFLYLNIKWKSIIIKYYFNKTFKI